MKQQVLIITYYWPPSGGAAVQRWLSFANKLAERGWQVHLLTVDEAQATYQLRDESLLAQVDPRIRVHTTRTSEPFKAYLSLFGKKSLPAPAFSNESNPSVVKKLSRFIRGNFFVPDPRKGWKRYAVPAALKLIREEGIENIITAGPPHSTHFTGKEVKEKTGVRWIADFHDLWTDVIYYDMLYHLPHILKKDRELERLILESADQVLTVGDRYRNKLLSKSTQLDPQKFSILRIGYDEDLFPSISPKDQPRFLITYTGSIADYYRPEILVDALKTVTALHPEIPVTLRFVGVLSDGVRNYILRSGLKDILDEVGYVTHRESVRYLRASTVLLLVNPVTRDEDMVIPGKVYEYLAARKPIINITRTTAETAELIRRCDSGATFDREDRKALEDHLSQLMLRWKKEGTLDLPETGEPVDQFSRGAITEELIRVLEQR